jgi:F-type H+-transporting ATPase subunit gamma
MAQSLEKEQNRLKNIHTVEPLLSALKTISLGSWQQAVNQQKALASYQTDLTQLMRAIIPYLKKKSGQLPKAKPASSRILIVAVGSERGLCGRFNAAIDEAIGEFIVLPQQSLQEYEIWSLGSRIKRYLQRRKSTPKKHWPLSPTTLPDFDLTNQIMLKILQAYQAGQFFKIFAAYNHYLSINQYETKIVQILPFSFPQQKPSPSIPEWDAPIIETDPESLYQQILQQYITLSFHTIMIHSAASEHATRFSLMEEAGQNAGRLIEDINLNIQAIRRQSITREMLELAAGAGLISPQSS